MFGRRADATLVRDAPMVRRFMPFISPRRNESLVYFDGDIEVDRALQFIDERNAQRPADRKMTLFHLFLRSLTMQFRARSKVNRFTKGGRLWQRKGVWVTFSALQAIREHEKMLTVKREFPEDETLDEMVDSILDRLGRRRGGEKTSSDGEMKLALDFLPPLLIHGVMGLLHLADHFGLLPKAMIDDDPMFTSVFVANLGSLGMDAGYHHLWEHGTCPAFATLGVVRERADGSRVMNVRYTYDERIEDGIYAGITLARVKEGLENPEKLV